MALRAVLPVDLSFGSARRPMNFDSARRAASRATIAYGSRGVSLEAVFGVVAGFSGRLSEGFEDD